MKRLVVVFVMSGVAGCKGDPSTATPAPSPAVAPLGPADGARSGSRLKLVYWQSGDGFTTWTDQLFDAQIGEICRVLPWIDGALYCIPDTDWPPGSAREEFDHGFFDVQPPPSPAATGGTPRSLAYTDENCTQPVVLTATPPPKFVATWVDDQCTTLDFQRSHRVDHLYRTGASLPADVEVFWRDQPDRLCYGGPSIGHPPVYALEEVSPSELVAISQRTAPSTERITTTYYTSSDGMQFPARAHDTSSGLDCYFAAPLGEPYTCIPNGAISTYYGAVDRCDRPAAVVPEHCPRPPAQFKFTTRTSFDPAGFFPVGEAVAGTCAGGPMSYFELGAAIPLAAATLEREHVTGRRLDRYHVTVGSWRGRVPMRLFDNQYGFDCDLQRAGQSAYCSVRPPCGHVEEFFVGDCEGIKITRFDATGCPEPPPALVDRRSIIASDRLEAMTFRLVQTSPTSYECRPDKIRVMYGLAPDLIPLDRFEQFTPVVDSE